MTLRTLLLLPLLCFPLTSQDLPNRQQSGDDQAGRQEWFYGQRRPAPGVIPAQARIDAVRAMQLLERRAAGDRQAAKATGRAVTTDPANWTFLGPQPTNPATTSVSSGRINTIAVDPRDFNTVYLGAADGGVWKSRDGGATWLPLTDDRESLANGSIVLDPSNPDTVYVGTGELNFSSDSYYGAGILKSTDGGASWTNIVGPFLRLTIAQLAIHPSNSKILLAASSTGLWRSADSAGTWTRVLGTVASTSVSFDPTNGSIAYAALGTSGGNTQNGVYRSTDAGLTWKQLSGSGTTSLPTLNVGRITLALAPSTPTTLYAAVANPVTKSLLGIWKTTDSGATWNKLNSAPSTFCASQCWYDMALAVHPKNPDIVYGGGFAIMRSLDGGTSWTTLPTAGPSGMRIHVDQHALTFTPDGSVLYIGNDGGAYKTSDIESAQVNWTQLNNTLGITQFYPGISTSVSNPDLILAGAQDNGTQQYSGGKSWNIVTCGDGGYTALDPIFASIQYAGCQNIDLRRSADAGNSFFQSIHGIATDDRTSFIPPLAADPANPETLYFGTYRLWRSLDGTGSWKPVTGDVAGGGTTVLRAVTPSPDGSPWVAVGSNSGKVYLISTTKAGPATSSVDRSQGLPSRSVSHVAFSPSDSQAMWVTHTGFSGATDLPGHIFFTPNLGEQWSDVSGDLPNIPVNDLIVDPDRPNTLYAATDAGVMFTVNAGVNWTPLGTGLARSVVTGLSLHRSTRVLRAGTHGRGVWEIALPLGGPSVQPQIQSLAPSTASLNAGDFTLTVTGSNFVPGTSLLWNGTPVVARVLDSSHLTATIPAANTTTVSRVSLALFAPVVGGGLSQPVDYPVGGPPSTRPDAFVSAANPTGGNSLAPRSIVSLYGVDLAGTTAVADSAPPLPFTLGGVTVSVAENTAVPLFFVSPGQINLQLPVPNVYPNGPTSYPLTITRGGRSTTIQISMRAYSPALFSTNAQGTGQGSITNAATGALAAPGQPVNKGDFISIYGTGLGDVRNRPGLGSPSPSSPLASTLVNPTVSVGGVNANVIFSGLAPNFVGLYQVNVQIPATAPSGNAVPVSLTIGGVTSNTVTIAVQ